MTDVELKALSDAATQGVWGYGWYDAGGKKHAYGYLPTVGYPKYEEGMEGPFPLYRAGTIGDTAAAEKAGYERGLREAANVAEGHRWGLMNDSITDQTAKPDVVRQSIAAAIRGLGE